MDPFIGQIIMFGGNFAPRGWAFCDGQLLPISQNTALFSILGTTYGGDGRTTFGLPDLRGRFAMHAGHGPGLTDRRLGAKFGVEDVKLNITELPPVSIPTTVSGDVSLNVNEEDPDNTEANGNILGNTDNNILYNGNAADTSLKLGGLSHNLSVNANLPGGGQSHTNMPPTQVVNFIIALQGVFPSRS